MFTRVSAGIGGMVEVQWVLRAETDYVRWAWDVSRDAALVKGDVVIEAADIREWRTHDVVDPDRHKIGVLEAVYVDTSSDEPAMATVLIGLPTRHRLVFVPLSGAIVGPGYVKVAYAKSTVRRSPAIGTDDVLPAEGEEAIFRHYGMDYESGAGGERQLARR